MLILWHVSAWLVVPFASPHSAALVRTFAVVHMAQSPGKPNLYVAFPANRSSSEGHAADAGHGYFSCVGSREPPASGPRSC